MTWHLYPARLNFPTFATAWDRLNAELYANHPMFDSRFIGALLEHFGRGDELLCLYRNADSIDAALILHPKGLGRWTLFLPSQAQAGAVLVKDAGLLETLLPRLPGYAWSLDLLSIDPLFSPDWTGLRLPRLLIPHANTMAVITQGDFQNYWQARPKKLRDNIRRYQRRAEQEGERLALAIWTEPEDITSGLARYGRLESAGWKGKEGTAIAPDNAQGKFYADMLARFANSRQAMILEIYLGARLVASRLFICLRQMWIALKTTYDESCAAFAPGRLLLREVIERAFSEMPDGRIEFYTNVTRDQADWATSLRPISHHQILRNAAVGSAISIIKAHRQRKAAQTTNFEPLQIHCYASLTALPAAAQALFARAETIYPEFSAEWFVNLQQSVFPDDIGVRYFVAERSGKPVAILPVRLVRDGRMHRIEALGNFYTSLYAPVMAGDATELDLVALLRAATDGHPKVVEMRFAPLDVSSPSYTAILIALRSIGWLPFRYFCFGNWHLTIDGNWSTHLAKCPGELRSTLKRKSKRFFAAGGTIEIITDPLTAEKASTDYLQVYTHSWKKPEPFPAFIPGLIRWLADKGWLRLGIARLADRPIAAEIWIVAHRKAYIFKLAYDQEYAAFAPGTLLTAHLMQHVIDIDHVTEVDYLIGDDAYKRFWMDQRRERWGIVAYNPASLMGIGLLLKEIAGRLLRQLQLYLTRTKNSSCGTHASDH